MNEETKKTLEPMSNDELDNVAGGSTTENAEILNAMMKLDPDGVVSVFDAANQADSPEEGEMIIARGTYNLLRKNVSDKIYGLVGSDIKNYYSHNGTKVSHKQIIDMINAKVEGWEFN